MLEEEERVFWNRKGEGLRPRPPLRVGFWDKKGGGGGNRCVCVGVGVDIILFVFFIIIIIAELAPGQKPPAGGGGMID